EGRHHERVRLGLVDILVGRAEEELVGLGARQEDDELVDQLGPADVAAFVADPLHQTDWVGSEFLEMAVLFLAAGHPGHDRCCHCPGIPSSPSASFWRSLVIANGASGCSSMFAMKPPRGVSATNVMARARSAARRK